MAPRAKPVAKVTAKKRKPSAPRATAASRKTKLAALETRLAEALEQQAATSDILGLMAGSPGNVQPVLDAVAQWATRLCRSPFARVMLLVDGALKVVAHHSVAGEAPIPVLPIALKRTSVTGRAVLDRRTVHYSDLAPILDTEFPEARGNVDLLGARAVLAVPLAREGDIRGAIFLWRREPGFFAADQVELVQTFARQAAIAIENVRLFKEVEARNRDLSEALEQQEATSEILRAIAGSPTDIKPVLETVVHAAARFCGAPDVLLMRVDGDVLRGAAAVGPFADVLRERSGSIEAVEMPLTRESVSGRAAIDRCTVHVHDLAAESEREYPVGRELQRRYGHRTIVSVPLLREGTTVGVIVLFRTEVSPFSERQLELTRTFADQAVIAIENVRLFTEVDMRNHDLSEALAHEAATNEILRIISSSPTDTQPVFDMIAQNAARLCGAEYSHVFRFDGELIHFTAEYGLSADGLAALRSAYPIRPGRRSAAARAIVTRATTQIADVLSDGDYEHGGYARIMTFRSILAVPMLREGEPIGAITVARPQAGTFPDRQVALIKTFADQAVIAVENVRLFTELGNRNRELSEALDQQTATSDILRVISRSPTDVQPAFATIADAALNLCSATNAIVFRFDGELIHLAAIASNAPDGADAMRKVFPRPPSRETAAARAVLTRSVVVIPDVKEDPEFRIGFTAGATGFRSIVAIPLMRDGNPIGVIGVGRAEPGPFPEKQIELLKTFADQAVIAIENVRLFKALEARTAELTRSVQELKALGEVGQAVSSTLDLDKVLHTIVSRAVQLAGADGGAIYEYDEAHDEFHLRTAERYPDELIEILKAKRIRKGEGALGRLAVLAEPVQIQDIAQDRTYPARVREALLRLEYRSALAIPLVREDHLLGGLVVNRGSAGDFAPDVIELLKTFATQSALAILNARLFRELGDKSRELEVASRHKSEFLANMSHELRTPLNAIIGFSEVLADQMFGEVNAKQAEYLADILESGRHLLSLINDILDLSKIEAGRMELDLGDFSLPSAIDNTVTLVRERAHRRGITLERALDERVGPIRADERKVKQVLLNLLSNALKFTPEGGRISVRANVRDGATEVSVTDTGVGIAPQDQAKVFEEFRQVGTMSKTVEGTGLGLAISRKFIELHGGKIWVMSEVGVGSTFGFTLPHSPPA